MKRISAIFVLTPGEQRVVIFLVLGLLAWTWLRQQQEVKRAKQPYLSVQRRPASSDAASPRSGGLKPPTQVNGGFTAAASSETSTAPEYGRNR